MPPVFKQTGKSLFYIQAHAPHFTETEVQRGSMAHSESPRLDQTRLLPLAPELERVESYN